MYCPLGDIFAAPRDFSLQGRRVFFPKSILHRITYGNEVRVTERKTNVAMFVIQMLFAIVLRAVDLFCVATRRVYIFYYGEAK